MQQKRVFGVKYRTMLPTNWQESAEACLGVRLGHLQQLGGGDFAQSFRATVLSIDSTTAPGDQLASLCTSNGLDGQLIANQSGEDLRVGDNIFIKTHADPPPLHFTTEALGLLWLKQTNSVRVPGVLGVDDDAPFLALRWIEFGSTQARHAVDEAEFGQQLARLHTAPCAGFGRVDSRTTGSLGLPNKPGDKWSEFYASQRLIPLMEIAAARGALPVKTLDKIERISFRLPEFVADDIQPSRLHGDLWAGNRVVDSRGLSWVIDPACHGGHREFDLAMMRLFGGFDTSCHTAYQEISPLSDGWRERVQLHQLAPLIVHAIKFGAAYRQATEDALEKYL